MKKKLIILSLITLFQSNIYSKSYCHQVWEEAYLKGEVTHLGNLKECQAILDDSQALDCFESANSKWSVFTTTQKKRYIQCCQSADCSGDK